MRFGRQPIPALLAGLLVAASGAGAVERRIDLVTNEGQRPEQAIERVVLVKNPAPPLPPTNEPPRDLSGRPWNDPAYAETDAPGTWRDALPVWRFDGWPTTTLPRDASGEVLADWIWSSPFEGDALSALFLPDTDNGTRFPRRFSQSVDAAGRFANGFVPGLTGGALFARRTFCLSDNLVFAPTGRWRVLADAQARFFVGGALVHDTCSDTPENCARAGVRSFSAPTPFDAPLSSGQNLFAAQVWGWQPGAPLGGLFAHGEIAYETTGVNLAVTGAASTGESVTATIAASDSGAVDAGVVLAIVSAGSVETQVLGAFAAGASKTLIIDTSRLLPGARADVIADAFDCAGRVAGGAVNLLGGASDGLAGPLAASGRLDETSESDNVETVRLAPRFDALLDGVAVASASIVLTGDSASGTTVRIALADGTPVGEAVAVGDRFALGVPLISGLNRFVARAVADGLESGPSLPVAVLFDADAPPRPVIETPAAGARLDRAEVLVSGSGGAPNARVVVTMDGEPFCESAPAGDGAWSCPLQVINTGDHVVVAQQRSRSGVLSEPDTAAFTIVLSDVDAGVIEPEPTDGGQSRRLGGGGGCDSAGVGAIALLMIFMARRRLFLVALTLASSTAFAQTADLALFPGPTPRVSGAWNGPVLMPSVALGLEYARDPFVLRDAASGERLETVVSDQLALRVVAAMAFHERLALSLSLPSVPWVATGAAMGDVTPFGPSTPAAGLADLSAGVLFGLWRGETTQGALTLRGSLPTGGSVATGTGRATGAAGIVLGGRIGRCSGGSELIVRTPGLFAATFEPRLGVSVAGLPVHPFVEAAAAIPLRGASTERTTLFVDGGLRWSMTAPVSLSASVGRGLTTAAGSPSVRALVAIEYRPVFESAPPPPPPPPPPTPPPPLPALVAPMILLPEEGETVSPEGAEIDGYAEPGATIAIALDGEPLSDLATEPDGTFRHRLAAVAPGTHTVTATQSLAGRTSEPGPPRTFIVGAREPTRTASERAQLIEQILRMASEQSGLKAKEVPEGVAVSVSIYFAFDREEIREGDRPKLRQLAKVIKAFPMLKVRIDSHTDSIGSPEYNLALSQRRAASGRQFLVEQEGIDPDRISCVGHGDTRPVASNVSVRGRARNRRFAEAVFIIP